MGNLGLAPPSLRLAAASSRFGIASEHHAAFAKLVRNGEVVRWKCHPREGKTHNPGLLRLGLKQQYG
ncbi:uncharacterized protein BDCG_16872 [Blastomyces dermatitidis ER-3]|uniref:Uncharacterized protein n=1 Tax=Ajellomyces dermatitidis (strain ER-3 / ATCC MYA-2586) TaxID=559297 RepID=A0ABX2VV55_AJEDR|nr:uncharacterized protein BDCG_16872 [Blastomyces dermatitidis ER-3]OAT01037.1 hypothetical protein BDCG_16872 [Blastomyces dermatitidis ER-3]